MPKQDRQLRMSPGSTMDKLWHYMLLNTSGTAKAAPPYLQLQLLVVGFVYCITQFALIKC